MLEDRGWRIAKICFANFRLLVDCCLLLERSKTKSLKNKKLNYQNAKTLFYFFLGWHLFLMYNDIKMH